MTARQLFEYLPEEYRDVDLIIVDDEGLEWSVQTIHGLDACTGNPGGVEKVWLDKGVCLG